MPKKWLVASLILLSLLSTSVYAGSLPEPKGWVNDFANVISQEYKEKLSGLISEVEAKTSSEIAVVTIESIAPYDEAAYVRLLFDKWRPGKKGKDNGVLVLLAVKERRWRIETGYGVEGILPDGLCGEIGRNFIVPYFKQGKYGEGLYQGVVQIAQVIAKEAGVSLNIAQERGDLTPPKASSNDFIVSIMAFIFLGILILPILLGRRYGTVFWGGGYSGGGFGGGGGGFGGFGGGGGGGGGAGGGF